MSDTLLDELSAIKDVEDTVVGNKVANFAYDDYAYEHNDANGVDTYNVNNHQNIPNGTASIMKVNSTILTKGWRAQASAITRMAMNHFLGRISYNLNKLNDLFSLFLTKLMAYMGVEGGIATVDTNGKVSFLENVVNTGDSDTPTENSTAKFTAGGAYILQQAVDGKAPVNHASSTTDYGVASESNYGHVRTKLGAGFSSISIDGTDQTFTLDKELHTLCLTSSNTSTVATRITFNNSGNTSYSYVILTYDISSGSGTVHNLGIFPKGSNLFIFTTNAKIKYYMIITKNNTTLTNVK